MKKALALAIALTGISQAFAENKYDFVSVDVNSLIVNSKKGQALQKDLQERALNLQKEQQEAYQSLQAKSEQLSKEAMLLSPEAQQQKVMDLQMAQRQIQREFQGKQEDLNLVAQSGQEQLRREFSHVAKELAKENNWGAVLNANESFVLATADEADVTDEVLKRLNKTFDDSSDDSTAEEVSA